MKKYLKYKNFIPLDFIEKKKNKENKSHQYSKLKIFQENIIFEEIIFIFQVFL